MTRTVTWQPIINVDYGTITFAGGKGFTVIDDDWPPGLCLCQAVEIEAAGVPSVIHDTLCGLLDEAAEDIGMNPNFYSEPDVELAKIEAVRNWLASLAKENHDASQT